MLDLKGRVAIVTGGSRGIGASIAVRLAEAGADVAINYKKSADEANKVAALIKKKGRKGLAIQADTASFADADKMVAEVVRRLGRLDILVCNAGINRDSVIWKMTEAQWDEVIGVNLKGYFNYNRAAAAYMKDQCYGRIINISSINGIRGKFGQANYAASKGGEIAMTKAIAKEVGKFGITANVVCPGMVRTEMAENIPREFLDKAVDETVLGRIAEPEDIANVVVFLASDMARHITGEVIKVDGGQYI